MTSASASKLSIPNSSIPPCQTLYVRNLNSKLPKQDLRRSLYILFSTYGSVLDVVALKTNKMRGQGHIVFRDIQSSTLAMRALNGFVFFGLEMQISFSKSKSHIISRLDGSLMPLSTQLTSSSHSDSPNSNLAVPGSAQKPSIFNAPGSASSSLTNPSFNSSATTSSSAKRPRDDENDLMNLDSQEKPAPPKRLENEEKTLNESASSESENDDEGAMDLSDDDDNDTEYD